MAEAQMIDECIQVEASFTRNCEVVNNDLRCVVHKEAVSFWCIRCLNLCCRSCRTSGQHHGHSIVGVDSIMGEMEKEFAKIRIHNMAALSRKAFDDHLRFLRHATMLAHTLMITCELKKVVTRIDDNFDKIDRHLEQLYKHRRELVGASAVNDESEDVHDRIKEMFVQSHRSKKIIKCPPVNQDLDPLMLKFMQCYSVSIS